jgi:hypothetical protein
MEVVPWNREEEEEKHQIRSEDDVLEQIHSHQGKSLATTPAWEVTVEMGRQRQHEEGTGTSGRI